MKTASVSSKKKCFKCGQFKTRKEFYKHPMMGDGLLGKCKTCAKADVMEHRLKNLERIRAYDRARANHPDRIAAAQAITKRWRAEDSRRPLCHGAVAQALSNGTLERQSCLVCGSEKSLAHHESYDYPLAVTWYCQAHHKARHKQMVINGIEP